MQHGIPEECAALRGQAIQVPQRQAVRHLASEQPLAVAAPAQVP